MSTDQTESRARRVWTGEPLQLADTVIQMACCPDCKGRGYFLINPFATGGSNGAGGIGNMTQCLTCKNAEAFYREHGKMPPELQAAYDEWLLKQNPVSNQSIEAKAGGKS